MDTNLGGTDLIQPTGSLRVVRGQVMSFCGHGSEGIMGKLRKRFRQESGAESRGSGQLVTAFPCLLPGTHFTRVSLNGLLILATK